MAVSWPAAVAPDFGFEEPLYREEHSRLRSAVFPLWNSTPCLSRTVQISGRVRLALVAEEVVVQPELPVEDRSLFRRRPGYGHVADGPLIWAMSKSSVGEPPAIPTRSVPPRFACVASTPCSEPRGQCRCRAGRLTQQMRRPRRCGGLRDASTLLDVIRVPPVVSGSPATHVVQLRRATGFVGDRLGLPASTRTSAPGAGFLDHRLVLLELVQGLRPHLPADAAHPVSAVRGLREHREPLVTQTIPTAPRG